MGFIENTAMRHRRGGGREVTVTSRHTYRKTKKDKREWRLTSGGGSKTRNQVERLKHWGARIEMMKTLEREQECGKYRNTAKAPLQL